MDLEQKLDALISTNNSLVCIGLDAEFEKLPQDVKTKEHPQFEFNKAIIDATHDLVCVYKPNSAFYEARGIEGIMDLKLTCDYIRESYPEIPIILDAKRGDIGHTNNGYITFSFDWLGVDAITLQPYPGSEALKPFLDRIDKTSIIWCRTSNEGAGEIQDLLVNNEPLYKHIARIVTTDWNKNNNCMLVVGATYPNEMREIREIAPNMTFLVPGIGAQGGDLEGVLKNGLRKDKKGLIISSSRGIIFAATDNSFAEKARAETEKLRDQINSFR